MPSKLGPHFIGTPGFERWLAAGVRIMKFDPTSLGASAQVPPGILVVGKLDQEEERLKLTDWKALKNRGMSPADTARLRFDAQRDIFVGPNKPRVDRYAANSRIDAWEDDNEVVPDDPAEAQWYAEYCIEMMRRYESIGKKRANFSFATGTPDIRPGHPDDVWPHLLPAVRHAHDHGHYLALHEYMGPEADLGVGRRQVDRHRQPKSDAWHGRRDANGNPDERYPYGLCPLRYRYIYDTYFLPAGLADTPLLITECGCDGVDAITPLDMEAGSWTHLRDGFWGKRGLNVDAHYASMLEWYDRRLREDEFVAGAMIFTVGASPKTRWMDFNIAGTGVEQRVLAYIAAERDTTDTPINAATIAAAVPKIPIAPDDGAKTPDPAKVTDAAEAAGFTPHVDLDHVRPGQGFRATWTFRNSGDATWTGDYRLTYTDTPHAETSGVARSPLGAPPAVTFIDAGALTPVTPGETVSLTLEFTAPDTPGLCGTNWRLQTPDGRAFGPTRWLRAVVEAD